MKTKKRGIYAALAAVLLITAMLVTTCSDPLNSLSAPQEEGQARLAPPPKGRAYLIVNIPEAGPSRTIIPTTPGTLYYKVDIAGVTVGTNTYDNTNAISNGNFSSGNSAVFNVALGDTYDVVVGAYTSFTAPNTFSGLIATGGETGVTIDGTGLGATDPIELEPIVNGTVTGDFSYDIAFPSTTPDTATISITAYATPAGTNLATQSNLITANSGTVSLVSGYYWVRVLLTKDRYEDVTYSHILHVYGSQESEWSPTLADLNKNTYDVIYNPNYTTPTPPSEITDSNGALGWAHGTTVTINSTAAAWTRAAYALDSWHTVAANASQTSANQWIFGSTLIRHDTTLYPKWRLVTGLTVTIVPYTNPADPGATLFSPAFVDFEQDDIASGLASPFQVVASGIDTPSDTDGWYFGSTLITGTATLTLTAISTALPTLNFDVIGEKEFTFHGKKSTVPFSAKYTIITTPNSP